MFRNWAKLRSLTGRQRVRLTKAWLWILAADVALRCLSLPKAQGRLVRAPPASSVPPSEEELHEWAWAVRAAAAHHLYPMRCLQRSLALQALLARSGQPAELKIGVRKEGEELEAHAWVEVGGRVLGDRAESLRSYATLGAISTRG